MYYSDHAPPHFHARYGDFSVMIDIETVAILRGRIPARQLKMLEEWCNLHKVALLENWRRSQEGKPLNPIDAP